MRTILGWRVLVLALCLSLAPASQAGAAGRDPVACAFARLDLHGKVGQIFMVAIDGTRPSGHTTALLGAWRPGGIILFSRNVGSAADLRALIAAAQKAARLPLLVSTDQEGGLVARIQVGLTPLPAPAVYGKLGSARRVYTDTSAQGRALRALGINLNLAPVVDVLDTPLSAIGSRSFGPDPRLDAALVAAAVQGYQSAGIGATAKHFLGLGEVQQNADLTLPVVQASRATLEARDMVPLRAAVRAGVVALMVTRVAIPALDPTGTAAYASRPMIEGVVRGELHFTGAVITDSLLSTAVLSGPGVATAALAALRAGDDILLLGRGEAADEGPIAAALAAVEQAVAHKQIPMARLDDAVRHTLQLKERLHLLPPC